MSLPSVKTNSGACATNSTISPPPSVPITTGAFNSATASSLTSSASDGPCSSGFVNCDCPNCTNVSAGDGRKLRFRAGANAFLPVAISAKDLSPPIRKRRTGSNFGVSNSDCACSPAVSLPLNKSSNAFSYLSSPRSFFAPTTVFTPTDLNFGSALTSSAKLDCFNSIAGASTCLYSAVSSFAC